MECHACDRPLVTFRVPESMRDHGPGETAAICTRCLALEPASEASGDPDFSTIIDAFPEGETGAAMALCVGFAVDSIALNREAIEDCMEFVSDRGVDPWLVLERLAASGAVQPEADLGRARQQLQQLLE